MTSIREVCDRMEAMAPLRLAEAWDNVGLLVGDPERSAQRVMTCLTVTTESATEAQRRRADLIVTHHPLPFRPLQRLTTAISAGRLLWQLMNAGISVYSPHTAWDSAAGGINHRLADQLGLINVRPLQPIATDPDGLGSGRLGSWRQPVLLREAIERAKAGLGIERVQYVGRPDHPIELVGVACGSGGSLLDAARRAGCQLLVTGETSFHSALEAASWGMALILTGHFASERFGAEALAAELGRSFPSLEVWACCDEADPIRWG
jgi:dinuclear metal center YbgI/SA1388 family protein